MMSREISLVTVLVRNEDMIFGEIDGETVMMSVETGMYYGLNETGALIWEMLAQPKSLKEIVAGLVDEYEVSPDQAEQETRNFVSNLLERDVLRIAEGKSSL